ncbi:MarR family winged helix-turn-helix transcriptional regulator [Luteimicrobium sp. DT211]|uniref:MarR family winged helix-turn-helix transcriptional regulator n=1 Tax=Luteimicrobium sp. DT211 TaxID=3393412 RepID=UPI003CE69ECF
MSTQATETAPALSDAQVEAWTALVALLATLPTALDNQLKRDAGMNMYEYHVLAALAASPGGVLPMTDLALSAQGSASRLSHAVTRLERAGWVERVSCAEAGRRTSALLTRSGEAHLRTVAAAHVREVRRLVVDALAPEQLAQLGDAARAIVGRVDPDVAAALGDTPCGAGPSGTTVC